MEKLAPDGPKWGQEDFFLLIPVSYTHLRAHETEADLVCRLLLEKKIKFSKFKSVLPKMSARSGLVGKNPPGPIWGHLRPFFPWTEKIKKNRIFCLFSLVGQWALFTL